MFLGTIGNCSHPSLQPPVRPRPPHSHPTTWKESRDLLQNSKWGRCPVQLGISNKIWPIHLRSILKILGHEIWKPRPTRGHFQTLLTSLVGFLHIFHPIFMKVQLLATGFSVAPSSIPKAWRSTLPLSSSIHSLAWTVMHETVEAVSQKIKSFGFHSACL